MTLVSKLKTALNKKEVAALVVSVCLMAYSSGANAFACKDATGKEISSYTGGGTGKFNVYVNLTPSLQAGQNLVTDLNSSISCRNEEPTYYVDWVSLNDGSTYGGALENFTGTANYYNSSYPLPVTTRTKDVSFTNNSYQPWNVILLLKPVSAASGILITKGSLIAKLNMYKYSTDPKTGQSNGGIDRFTWDVYANNTVVIPTGGCDVSSRNVTVTLPDYPGTVAVPLTVYCAQNQRLAYYLTGTTADTASTIFTNTSSSNPATGVGVQLSNRNGVVATNKNVSLGTVGTSSVSLGLTASYARTAGQVVAGNVQSIIGVTFVYE
jgi:minor fimbrial subunit